MAENQRNQVTVDSNSPLYMHASDNPGITLVPVRFNGVGYRSWKRGVLRALSAKNKLGFINGECEKPDPEAAEFRQWERCDDMVTSWILNSLSKDIADSLEYAESAAELWKELEDRYDQTNGAKLYQIQKEINDLRQGSMDVTGYYTKMMKLWEELNTVDASSQCKCQCTCGAKANMHKAEQDRKLIQFLMGLNESYTVIRDSILLLNPLPSSAQAFSLLVQEEKQREIRPGNQLAMDSISQNANAAKSSNFRTDYTAGRQHYTQAAPSRQGYGSNRNNYGSNWNNYGKGRQRPMCDYCNKLGHVMENCFKRRDDLAQQNSHPNNFQGDKGKRVAANVDDTGDDTKPVNYKEREGRLQDGGQILQQLSKEQYSQLLSILDTFRGSSMGGEVNSVNMNSGAVNNFAGEVKSVISEIIGLEPKVQKHLFRGKEKEDHENLHLAGVKDNSKVLVMEEIAVDDETPEEVTVPIEISRGGEAVAEVSAEVDKLSELVSAVEAVVFGGTNVEEKDIICLTEMLMRQLLKLDGIEAEGEGKVQRKMEVRRIVSLEERLDAVKARNSNSL